MNKLYRSAVHRNHWIAFVPGTGWLIFPARENGWELRGAAHGLDPLYLREVPGTLAADAGFPQFYQAAALRQVA